MSVSVIVRAIVIATVIVIVIVILAMPTTPVFFCLETRSLPFDYHGTIDLTIVSRFVIAVIPHTIRYCSCSC